MADHVAAASAREAEEERTGPRTTAILFPLRMEARPFLERLGRAKKIAHGRVIAWSTALFGSDLLVVRTGVGRRRTLAALDALSTRRIIGTVISAGFGGALASDLGVGDIVAATEVVDEKLARTETTWLPREVQRGRVLTMERVIGDPAEKRRLYAQYQACAVDMESAFVGEWCAQRGIQFGVVRAITDDAATSITPAVAQLVSNQRWSIVSGALGMAYEPRRSIRELWRLRGNARVACDRLAETLYQALQVRIGSRIRTGG